MPVTGRCSQRGPPPAWPRQWAAQRQGHRLGEFQKSTEPLRPSWVCSDLDQGDERTPRCARTSGSSEREGLGRGMVGKWARGRGAARNCLVVSRQDKDHELGRLSSGMLQRPGNQLQDGGGGCWQEGQGLPQPPSLQPMVNGHCVWFPAVASSPARTLVFLPPARSFPLISKQQRLWPGSQC